MATVLAAHALQCVTETPPGVAARSRLQLEQPAFSPYMSCFPTPNLDATLLRTTTFDKTLFDLPTVDRDVGEPIVARRGMEAVVRVDGSTRRPYSTLALAAVHVVLYISTVLSNGGVANTAVNPLAGAGYATLHEYGALWPAGVQKGQLHRLLLAALLSPSLPLTLLNAAALLALAVLFESRVGWQHVLLLMVVCSVAGAMTSCIFTPTWLHAGAAPAVLAVANAVFCFHSPNPAVRPRRVAVWFLVIFTTVLLVLGAFPGSSNWASVGAMIAALLLSTWLYSPPSQAWIGAAVACVLAAGLVIEFAVFFLVVSTDVPWCSACLKAACYPHLSWCDPQTRFGALA